MLKLEDVPPEKTRSWPYAGSIPCEVRVVRHHTLCGSADYEDPAEVAEDRAVDQPFHCTANPNKIIAAVKRGHQAFEPIRS